MTIEAGEDEAADAKDAFPVLEALRPPLATLMGKAGFRGLLSRSLAAASEEVRWLKAVHVQSDGSLTELEELQLQLAPALFSEGRTAFLAQILSSLVALIGERLTVQLLRETWPKLALEASDFGGDET